VEVHRTGARGGQHRFRRGDTGPVSSLVMELRTLGYFVAVAEELHFGRAAARLHMTQPPLSRAVQRLEADLGAALLRRSPAGVELTPAGAALYAEARALLERAGRVRDRVAAAAGAASITIGTLGDTAERAGPSLAAAFRARHPGVEVRVREAGITDPTAGLRAGLADVALTRAPFDDAGIVAHELRADPVGVVLRADDPLADRPRLRLADLAGRRWFRFPEGTDAAWSAYWRAGSGGDGPVVRTVHECLQAVLWSGTIGLTTLGHALPDGLVAVPLTDMPPSRLVVAWNAAGAGPLVRSFAEIAATLYRPGSGGRGRQ
jgi:DNA-binding transcriptional LysR family regulator